jgi:Fe2+ transport system protein FeoA
MASLLLSFCTYMAFFGSTSGVECRQRVTRSLDHARKRSRLIIRKIPDDKSRMQLIRLGLVEGDAICVVERLPGGTVVIEKNRRDIAIGASLAKTIRVDDTR